MVFSCWDSFDNERATVTHKDAFGKLQGLYSIDWVIFIYPFQHISNWVIFGSFIGVLIIKWGLNFENISLSTWSKLANNLKWSETVVVSYNIIKIGRGLLIYLGWRNGNISLYSRFKMQTNFFGGFEGWSMFLRAGTHNTHD